jgi:hypothetical protein
MPIPQFKAADRKQLGKLGVSPSQIEQLQYALVHVRLTLSAKPTRNGTISLLDDIAKLSADLSRKLETLAAPPDPEHGLAHAMIEEQYWTTSGREFDDGPSSSHHLLPRLAALGAAAIAARDQVENSKQTRQRTAHLGPIGWIDSALLNGWIRDQGPRVRNSPGDGTLAGMIADAKANPPMAPYPKYLLPSKAAKSPFREIAGICYRAVGGNEDPVRAIENFLTWKRKSHREMILRLEAGIAEADRKARRKKK